MKTYAVKIELEVDDPDDLEFSKAEESIKDDIRMELNGCRHGMDIVYIDVYKQKGADMVFAELQEINYALGHMTHKMFEEWYGLKEICNADPTEENKRKVEIAKGDFDMIQKAYKLFNKIGWEPKSSK